MSSCFFSIPKIQAKQTWAVWLQEWLDMDWRKTIPRLGHCNSIASFHYPRFQESCLPWEQLSPLVSTSPLLFVSYEVHVYIENGEKFNFAILVTRPETLLKPVDGLLREINATIMTNEDCRSWFNSNSTTMAFSTRLSFLNSWPHGINQQMMCARSGSLKQFLCEYPF